MTSKSARLVTTPLLGMVFPQLETVVIPNAHHLLHMQQPDLVAQAMSRFLSKHTIL